MKNLFMSVFRRRSVDVPVVHTPRTFTHMERVIPKTDKDGNFLCPNCGNDQFFEGPSGGMCTNVKCTGCGLDWNSNPFVGVPWEYLGKVGDTI